MRTRNNYKEFTELDFIKDVYFQEWIIRPNPGTERFWEEFVAGHPDKKETVDKATRLLKSIGFKEEWPAEEKLESALQQALARINGAGSQSGVPSTSLRAGSSREPGAGKVVPMWKRYGWVAAAVVVFLVCGLWFMIGRNQGEKPSIAVVPKVKQDVAPGGNKAILTLADGTKVVLDTTDNGAITHQGNVTVIKLDGQLAYTKDGKASTEVLYNTITTPKGGQYQLVLADGTKVWLNAASSLRFPTAFAGQERRVELTGEGYFEVAHNAQQPFHVNVGTMDVQVLGTHFNINSYQDDDVVKTTLLEGSVLVSSKDLNRAAVLKPGEQANMAADQLSIDKDVDTDEIIAWKNGLFVFNNVPLATIMKQLERWYDVKVVYQGKVPQERYVGSPSRNTNLSEVLKVLEYSGIHCRIEGKTLVVLPE